MQLQDWHHFWKGRGRRELRALLMDVWDPIGVRGEPGAADEYDSYLGLIVGRLRTGATIEQIAELLTDLGTENMGLAENLPRDREAALAIWQWYQAADSSDSRDKHQR